MTVHSSSNDSASNNTGDRITYFGLTDSRGKKVRFGIKEKDRSKHTYVIGKTGMGKSTLLENMAIQDIQNGEGVAFIDPHGGTAEKLLEYVPEHRVKDVLYFAPFDMEYPISFNVMEDIGVDKRHLVVNGLMSTFEKIWVDAWSARMAYILNNTLLALLEYPGSTLLGVNRMLADKEYRKKIVDNITDPSVRSFWVDEFAKYTERFAAEATPAIQNKVGQFTSNPLVRNIIGQSRSSFDLRKIMDEKKILIINLSKGRVGEGNANLLGSMLITKIYLAAMSRADVSPAVLNKLPNFFLYVDEFQSFANKSFADILSEARKYKLNLTIAHQYIEQMEEEVRDAVFGNVGTTIAFRVGPFDAEQLETVFAPQFTAENLVNLGLRQIYLSLMIDGVGSRPFSATTMPPIEAPEISYRDVIIANSRKTFGTPRNQVEDEIRVWHETSMGSGTGAASTAKSQAEKPPNKITVRADGTRITDPVKVPETDNSVDKQTDKQTEKTISKPSATEPSAPLPQVRPQAPLPVKEQGFKTPATALPRLPVQQAPTLSVEATKQSKANDRETEFRRAITQSQNQYARNSAPPPRPNKGPTDKNLSQLRDALKSVMSEAGMIHPNASSNASVQSGKSPAQGIEGNTASVAVAPASPVSNVPKPLQTSVSLKDTIMKAQKEKMERMMQGSGQIQQVKQESEVKVEKPVTTSTVTKEQTPPVQPVVPTKEIKEIPEEELKKILDIKQ